MNFIFYANISFLFVDKEAFDFDEFYQVYTKAIDLGIKGSKRQSSSDSTEDPHEHSDGFDDDEDDPEALFKRASPSLQEMILSFRMFDHDRTGTISLGELKYRKI